MKVYLCYNTCTIIIMYESMPVYLDMCRNEDVCTLYVYMQTCCRLQEVQVDVMHNIHHTFSNLFTYCAVDVKKM